jgi:hypothetical protein
MRCRHISLSELRCPHNLREALVLKFHPQIMQASSIFNIFVISHRPLSSLSRVDVSMAMVSIYHQHEMSLTSSRSHTLESNVVILSFSFVSSAFRFHLIPSYLNTSSRPYVTSHSLTHPSLCENSHSDQPNHEHHSPISSHLIPSSHHLS